MEQTAMYDPIGSTDEADAGRAPLPPRRARSLLLERPQCGAA